MKCCLMLIIMAFYLKVLDSVGQSETLEYTVKININAVAFFLLRFVQKDAFLDHSET